MVPRFARRSLGSFAVMWLVSCSRTTVRYRASPCVGHRSSTSCLNEQVMLGISKENTGSSFRVLSTHVVQRLANIAVLPSRDRSWLAYASEQIVLRAALCSQIFERLELRAATVRRGSRLQPLPVEHLQITDISQRSLQLIAVQSMKPMVSSIMAAKLLV